MVKKFSMLALAGLIALPAVAIASGGGASNNDLERKIEQMSQQLDQMRASLAQQQEANAASTEAVADLSESVSDLDDRSESWDLASRFQFYGDFRARYDYLDADSASGYNANDVARGVGMAMNGMGMGAGPYTVGMLQQAMAGMGMYSPQQLVGMFQQMGITPDASQNYKNTSMFTNRFRFNMRVKATENVEFKARLAMYKTWGMQSNTAAVAGGPYTLDAFDWDGNMSRQPSDSDLIVDRAFVNWNNIGGAPVWFSVGRRPTTDGPPAQMRLGTKSRMATPILVMDYPFDGISVGYAYRYGGDAGTGRVRFCYGRGFEDGMANPELSDMDFGGLSWDVIKKGDMFINFQSFLAANMINTPDGITFGNPLESNGVLAGNGYLDKANLGDLLHTSVVYLDKFVGLNVYGTGAWSRTMPDGTDEMGTTLLGSWWEDPGDKDGYMVLAGLRYDIDEIGLKIGAEYNWGSENWIAMSPGHDDLYNSKLATRGWVSELYAIWDLPTGDAVSKFAQTFMRVGWQHYDYEYTGSGTWLGAPVKIDDLTSNPMNAQFYPAIDEQDQVYVTFEAFF